MPTPEFTWEPDFSWETQHARRVNITTFENGTEQRADRGPSPRGAGAAAVPTSHLFRCRPRPGGGRVTVVVTDRFGGRSYGEVLADGTVRLWSGRG